MLISRQLPPLLLAAIDYCHCQLMARADAFLDCRASLRHYAIATPAAADYARADAISALDCHASAIARLRIDAPPPAPLMADIIAE